MSLKDNPKNEIKFMESKKHYKNSNIVIFGVPMDCTCSFKSGTRFGPKKIREVSEGIEEYSLYLDKSLVYSNFFDYGDIDIPLGKVEESLSNIARAEKEILDDGKFPLIIGGEHLLSVPAIREVYNKYGDDLIVLHFDAHADLRTDYLGERNSHASTIRIISSFMPPKNIYQFGIRSGTKDEFMFAKKNTNLFKFDVYEPLQNIMPLIKEKPVYVTLDIDVLDPAYANGTGTPEPGGISTKELLQSVHLLNDLNLVGFDIVEVSPEYDPSDRTALTAAKIIREIILMAS